MHEPYSQKIQPNPLANPIRGPRSPGARSGERRLPSPVYELWTYKIPLKLISIKLKKGRPKRMMCLA